MGSKLLDLNVGTATFTANPHADFVTIFCDGEEVTLRGVDLWEYVGACIKREKITSTLAWMESQPVATYIPPEFCVTEYTEDWGAREKSGF